MAFKLCPRNPLPPQMLDYLQNTLKNYTSLHSCIGNVENGFSDYLLKCKMANRELEIIFQGGYSLVDDITPLSTIIVLEKTQRDLKE